MPGYIFVGGLVNKVVCWQTTRNHSKNRVFAQCRGQQLAKKIVTDRQIFGSFNLNILSDKNSDSTSTGGCGRDIRGKKEQYDVAC